MSKDKTKKPRSPYLGNINLDILLSIPIFIHRASTFYYLEETQDLREYIYKHFSYVAKIFSMPHDLDDKQTLKIILVCMSEFCLTFYGDRTEDLPIFTPVRSTPIPPYRFMYTHLGLFYKYPRDLMDKHSVEALKNLKKG